MAANPQHTLKIVDDYINPLAEYFQSDCNCLFEMDVMREWWSKPDLTPHQWDIMNQVSSLMLVYCSEEMRPIVRAAAFELQWRRGAKEYANEDLQYITTED